MQAPLPSELVKCKAHTYTGVRAQLRARVHDATLVQQTKEQLVQRQQEYQQEQEQKKERAEQEKGKYNINDTREAVSLVKAMASKLESNNALKYAYDASLYADKWKSLEEEKQEYDNKLKMSEKHQREEQQEATQKEKKARKTIFHVDTSALAARAEAEKRAEELHRKRRAEEKIAAAKAEKVQSALDQLIHRTRERAACAIQREWRKW